MEDNLDYSEHEEDDLPPRKRVLRSNRTNTEPRNSKEKPVKHKSKLKESVLQKCDRCKQYLDEIVLYNGHPNNSVEEIFTISNENLGVFTGEESNIEEDDQIPSLKLTHFDVYDQKGHLCNFDTGLIEKNVQIFLSGYVKPIYEENPSPENGHPTHDIGPINAWWTAGFDGGERALVGVTTQYAEYYLMEPSAAYEPFWKSIHDKVMVWKLTIEFLLDEAWRNPSYEDLLQHLESSGKLSQPEETLLKNAQFVCDQVDNYYDDPPDDEQPLITLSCMRSLVKLSGITFKSRSKIHRLIVKDIKKKVPTFTKATTTKLVRSLFETIFSDQIDKQGDEKSFRKKRCGVCEACQSPDCGNCSNCKNMLKFGGNGKSKQACKLRRCPYMAIQNADESDNDEECDSVNESKKQKNRSKRILHSAKWLKKPTSEISGKKYYDLAQIGDDIIIKPGDHVMLYAESPNEPFYVAEVAYMYETAFRGKMFHANLFCRGNDSILGETTDPRELFAVDECEDCPLGTIVKKAEVEFRKPPADWADLGGNVDLPPLLEDNGYSFFVSKRYDKYYSCFVDLVSENNMDDNVCNACKRKVESKKYRTPVRESNGIRWKNDLYTVGTGVFMQPDIYEFKKNNNREEVEPEMDKVDEEIYPEFYRKKSDKIKGSNIDTVQPFIIGIIEKISTDSTAVVVRLLCRPDDTKNAMFLAYRKDINLVYWTNVVLTIDFEKITGMCFLTFGENVNNIDEWSRKGPYRFYFTELYDFERHMFSEVPTNAMKIGHFGKGKGKGKGKSVKSDAVPVPIEWEPLANPLKCMDVFAGCGGLSEGLHQSGIAVTKWAIEKEKAAAQAFKLNNPDCKVFHDDCNEILQQVMAGEGKERGLPEKGEVELLVGGPPCQGFSGMNRFNASQYSLFKSSLMVTYLSFCEYYRPKYFILENVRNFVSFKRSMVLKLTIRCLIAMGYQVTFGVLQAGHYGIPQTRRRLIIMAAAPGYVLPKYPEPQHVFNKRGCQLSFVVDNVRFVNGNSWTESAPYRTICVRDAMSDLPDIHSGFSKIEMPYDSDPISHFQKSMRYNNISDMVQDHICKEMSAVVEARISHIPTYPGADWRDLPNICVKLTDGTTTNKLRYPYITKNQSKKDQPRGVCICSTGELCDAAERQSNTLIPWCLPHTADRHNHWAGLYGRLEWDGFFGTTITNPEPMGKQGRVLHPEQHRVVSVRECARSQGFPDRFKFYGNILDKHRQVGNAVPPPLGCAIGKELCKAYIQTLTSKVSSEE